MEAACVFPLFLFAMLCFLGLFYLLQTEQEMTEALHVAARKSAVAFGVKAHMEEVSNADEKKTKGQIGEELLSLTAIRLAVTQYLKTNGCYTYAIDGGVFGVSFRNSLIDEEYVDLYADYKVKLPISFFSISKLPVSVHVRARKWIGAQTKDEASKESGWVYITKYGRAYHTSVSCRYLDLTIRSVAYETVRSLRNKDGAKYYRCSCVKGTTQAVFITDYGREYHADTGCSDLARNVYRVKQDKIGARHACSGCSKEES